MRADLIQQKDQLRCHILLFEPDLFIFNFYPSQAGPQPGIKSDNQNRQDNDIGKGGGPAWAAG